MKRLYHTLSNVSPSYSSYCWKIVYTNPSTVPAFNLHTLDLRDEKKPKSLMFKSGDWAG